VSIDAWFYATVQFMNSMLNFGTTIEPGLKAKTRIKTRTRLLKLCFFSGKTENGIGG
jgi:hypothetical protein